MSEKFVLLGDLLEDGKVSYGIVQPGEPTEDGVRVVRVGDIRHGLIDTSAPLHVRAEISAKHSRTVLQGGELLLSLVGTVGETAVVPDSLRGWNVARAVAVIRPTTVAASWLHLALQSPSAKAQIDSVLNTTVQATLNLSDLKRIRLPLQPAAQQQAITEVLGALHDKIAANTKLASALEGFIQAMYAQMIVTSTKVPILDVIDIDYGEAFKGEHFSQPGKGRPLIRIRDLSSLMPKVWTTEARAREITVAPGDVVVGMDAEFLPTPWFGLPGLLNQRVCRARSDRYGNAFVWQSLIRPLGAIQNEKSATTVIHLNKSDLVRSTIDMPRQTALAAFERDAEPAFKTRVAISTENRSLANIRDTLLPQLMSGKLRVRDAERTVSEVL